MKKFKLIVREESGNLNKVGVYSDTKENVEKEYIGKIVKIEEVCEENCCEIYCLPLELSERKKLEEWMNPDKFILNPEGEP